MLYKITKTTEGGYDTFLGTIPVYAIRQRAWDQLWVMTYLSSKGVVEGILDSDPCVDLLIDRMALSLRNAGHLARVAGGLVIFRPVVVGGFFSSLPSGVSDMYISGTGFLCSRGDGTIPPKVLVDHPVTPYNLQLELARPATIGERIDAGDASFDLELSVMFIPMSV